MRIHFRTLRSRTARHEIAVLLTLVLLPMTVQALDDWQPLPTGEMDRIAFGSCAKQWEPQPIWNGVVAADPDLVLKARGADGRVGFVHEISVGELL